MLKEKIVIWTRLARIPFFSVSLLPFILGSFLPLLHGFRLYWPPIILGVLAISLIQFATHLNGEVDDIAEDRLSATMGRNRFSGGSQVLVEGLEKPWLLKLVALIAIVAAFFLGLYIQFGLRTGPWALPLGAIGGACGYFYSMRPFRWVKRGVGEVMIAFCFGWLTVSMGYYLQTQHLSWLATLLSIPIALSVFNIILINEFPDYSADMCVGKRHLVVRMGKGRAVLLYAAIAVVSWIFGYWGAIAAFGWLGVCVFSPVAILSFGLVLGVLNGGYRRHQTLEKICGLTIVVNLATALMFIIATLISYWKTG